jgi:hypothetical protein
MTIASLQLTKPPVRLDEYGQPCFEIQRDKGLFEAEDCRLTNTAKLEGYTGVVTKMLIETACDEIQRAAGRRPVEKNDGAGSCKAALFRLSQSSGGSASHRPFLHTHAAAQAIMFWRGVDQ